VALTPWQTAVRAHRAPFYTMDGEEVTYARGENSVELTAIKLDQGVMVDDVEGVKALVWDLAFMVKAADLVFGSNTVTPQRGDTITDAAGVVYDVQGDPRHLEDSDEWQIPVQKVAT
jgi:hypothetical protein